MKTVIKVVLLIMLVFVLAGCKSSKISDEELVSLFFQELESCFSGCLFGITPGQTTADEAISFIDSSALFHESEYSLSYLNNKNTVILNDMKTRWNTYHVEVTYNDNQIVNKVLFSLPEITLGDIMIRIGEPDYVYFAKGYSNHGDLSCVINFYWIDQGITLRTGCIYGFEDGKPGMVDENLAFPGGYLVVPGFDGFKEVSPVFEPEKLLEWDGFKHFDDYLK